jgi:hypothetical protein
MLCLKLVVWWLWAGLVFVVADPGISRGDPLLFGVWMAIGPPLEGVLRFGRPIVRERRAPFHLG